MPGECCLISTGIHFKVECKDPNTKRLFSAQLYARSNTFGSGLTIDAGIIDADYEGEILLSASNKLSDYNLIIRKHSPIAQIKFSDFFPRLKDEIWINDVCFKPTNERIGGFGSTKDPTKIWELFAQRHDFTTFSQIKYTYVKNILFFNKFLDRYYCIPNQPPAEELLYAGSKFLPETQMEYITFDTAGKKTNIPVPIKTAN